MEIPRLGSGISVVAPPKVVKRFRGAYDETLQDQIREALVHQAPYWVDAEAVEIVGVARRKVRRSDAAERNFDGIEMLITAQVRERNPSEYAMPIFARFEHWNDPWSTGTVVREMWVKSRRGPLPIMQVSGPSDEQVVPYAHWQVAMQAWEDLQAYAEHGTLPTGR